ncbi:MAG: hypothetical protein RL710_1718 [Pseudomonadota bacterium]
MAKLKFPMSVFRLRGLVVILECKTLSSKYFF